MKKPWLIDGEVLKQRTAEIANDVSIDTTVKMFILLGEIQSGRFNVKDKEQPILKVGDMVRHLLHPEWEATAIKRISASGKSVVVYFPRHYGTYLVKHLDKVSDIETTAQPSEAAADQGVSNLEPL